MCTYKLKNYHWKQNNNKNVGGGVVWDICFLLSWGISSISVGLMQTAENFYNSLEGKGGKGSIWRSCGFELYLWKLFGGKIFKIKILQLAKPEKKTNVFI